MLPMIADNFGRIHDTSIARLKILFPKVKIGDIYANFVYNSAMHIARSEEASFDKLDEKKGVEIEKDVLLN